MKIEIDVDIPEGYRATGEHRAVERFEFFLSGYGKLDEWDSCFTSPCKYIILEKLEPSGEELIGKLCYVWDEDDVSDFDVDYVVKIIGYNEDRNSPYLYGIGDYAVHARMLTDEEIMAFIGGDE